MSNERKEQRSMCRVVFSQTVLACVFFLLVGAAQAFSALPVATTRARLAATDASEASNYYQESRLFCICIDCKLVTSCKAYHFVETKHEQPHMTTEPTFTPREGSPTIHVNVRTHRDDDVVARMWKEHKEETARAEQKQKEGKADTNDGPLRGEKVYDLTPSTTVEYDVVACEDFVEDKGCWVRNMPEEIRKANPDFVPT